MVSVHITLHNWVSNGRELCLVWSMLLIIQYISNYSPHPKALSIHKLRTCHAVMTKPHWTQKWNEKKAVLTWLFFVGIVVFLEISLVNTPPRVSIPRDSGVTSSNNTSVTSPARTPPWTAAPTATASSGFTDLLGWRPKISWTVDWTWKVKKYCHALVTRHKVWTDNLI